MADSLRARLLVWYAGIVMIVIAMVGAAVCWMTWRSRLAAIDAELARRGEHVAQAVRPGPEGSFDVELPADLAAYFQRPESRAYYAVWRADGSLVDRSDPDIASGGPQRHGAYTRHNNREVVVHSGGLTVLAGRDISDVWNELWSLAATVMSVALIGIAAALAVAWSLAGRALAPVQRINETARRMAEGDLTARIAIDRTETELGQVALALNLAFDRQRESIERQRQFTADASHQLRTPVATMMAELEWALMRERSSEDYREALETCRRAGTRMQALVEGLLTLARAESGELPLQQVETRLDGIVDDTSEMLRPYAEQRQVALHASLSPEVVVGDADRLHDLASNLIFNAIAYNRPGGTVTVEVSRDRHLVVFRVRDTGIGIAASDLPKIFDRFYRGETARTREPAGAGLGLALAKWIVRAHHGSIECSSEPGRYTDVVVLLPAADHAAAGAGEIRRSARFATPPIAPMASTASATPSVQIDVRPSAASSE